MFLSRSTQMLTLMRPTCSRIVIVRNRQKGIVVEPKDLGRFQRSIEKSFMKLAQRRFGLKSHVIDLLSSGEFDSAYEDLNVDILKVIFSHCQPSSFLFIV
ncbi:unnamed protein product [Soboliphyme baturini]|uniref:Kinesin motor domain-containing protein n=1 Tax=Soboliphyme baturini TaxID=241478 RepID=A0A183I8V9_9BILA|nr:unnamed protein product [Soboliphyme baturini]